MTAPARFGFSDNTHLMSALLSVHCVLLYHHLTGVPLNRVSSALTVPDPGSKIITVVGATNPLTIAPFQLRGYLS
jgi:hypothetical protein